MGATKDVRIVFREGTAEPFSPGEHIHGTVVLANSEPLSLSELVINLYGQADTHIFRKYFFKFAFADFYGRGFIFQKLILLLDGPAELQPGEHSFKFSFQIPFVNELMKENWKRFMKWRERSPFLGKDSQPHPLPPAMQNISLNQMFGNCKGSVSYNLDVTSKKGPNAKFWSMSPSRSRSLQLVTPRPQFHADTTLQQQSILHQYASGGFTVHLNLPCELVQGNQLPLTMRVEGENGVVLEAVSVTMTVALMLRGRSLLWPEKRTTATPSWQLVSRTNGSMVLGPDPILIDQQCVVPTNVPVSFATLNVACVEHIISVKYTLRAPGESKKITGKFKDVSIRLLSWKPPPGQFEKGAESLGWFDGQVLNPDQYREHLKARKKNKNGS